MAALSSCHDRRRRLRQWSPPQGNLSFSRGCIVVLPHELLLPPKFDDMTASPVIGHVHGGNDAQLSAGMQQRQVLLPSSSVILLPLSIHQSVPPPPPSPSPLGLPVGYLSFCRAMISTVSIGGSVGRPTVQKQTKIFPISSSPAHDSSRSNAKSNMAGSREQNQKTTPALP